MIKFACCAVNFSLPVANRFTLFTSASIIRKQIIMMLNCFFMQIDKKRKRCVVADVSITYFLYTILFLYKRKKTIRTILCCVITHYFCSNAISFCLWFWKTSNVPYLYLILLNPGLEWCLFSYTNHLCID